MSAVELLKACEITKNFDGVHALKSVDFDLREGEVHALVGENGAGKSTLIKIITGAIQADSGTLSICGKDVIRNDPSIARTLGVIAIYQQPVLFPHLSVAENIALGLEVGSAWRRVDWKRRHQRARELIERAGASLDPDRLVSTLSMPEQQLVEIARAIGTDAKIVIMDEPTSSLTVPEIERLFGVIQHLRERGVGIIYISHRLEEISLLADRITVLRDGEKITTIRRGEIERADLIRMMVGRELSTVFPKRDVAIGGVVLEVRDLHSTSRGLRGISFEVHAGEILGIAGLVGSGRTELAETLFGLSQPDGGEIRLRGTPARIGSPAEAIRKGIGYVPEDRQQHGIVAEMSVASNTTLANLDEVSHLGLIRRRREKGIAESYVGKLRIKTDSVDAEVGTLSGGNQQKTALARWLATHPSVLILDEPTQGIDVGSKTEIYSLMRDLVERGLAIIMISSELPEILGMSDRIAVMRNGTITGVLGRQEATQAGIMSLALEGT